MLPQLSQRLSQLQLLPLVAAAGGALLMMMRVPSLLGTQVVCGALQQVPPCSQAVPLDILHDGLGRSLALLRKHCSGSRCVKHHQCRATVLTNVMGL